MNVYNEAHNLAQAIKECEEFKAYDELKKKIDANPELAKVISDFQMIQMQAQLSQMSGQETSDDVKRTLRNTASRSDRCGIYAGRNAFFAYDERCLQNPGRCYGKEYARSIGKQ